MVVVAAAFALVAIKVLAFWGATDGQQACSAKVKEKSVFIEVLH
jgi:hypothetical protein